MDYPLLDSHTKQEQNSRKQVLRFYRDIVEKYSLIKYFKSIQEQFLIHKIIVHERLSRGERQFVLHFLRSPFTNRIFSPYSRDHYFFYFFGEVGKQFIKGEERHHLSPLPKQIKG